MDSTLRIQSCARRFARAQAVGRSSAGHVPSLTDGEDSKQLQSTAALPSKMVRAMGMVTACALTLQVRQHKHGRSMATSAISHWCEMLATERKRVRNFPE